MKRTVVFALTAWLSLLMGASVEAQKTPSHWADWRGPFLNGVAPTDAPTTFSDKTNVKWKLEIPGRGHSTPIVWGDKLFLTTAIPTGKTVPAPVAAPTAQGQGGRSSPNGGAGALAEHKFDVLCLDRKTGKIIWQKTARIAAPHEGYHRAYGSFASNSPVTDGKYVYASFGSRGIFCFDMNGKLIWEKDLGVKLQMRLQFGEGVAPVVDQNRLILNCDHEAGSFIVVLDKLTGKELWRAPREEQSSWSTPLVVEHAGRRQIIVSATKRVRSYDPQTGKVIWECGGLGGNVIPAPVYVNGVVYVMSGFRDPKLLAIKLGKEGDLTGTDAVLWSHTRGLSYTASPVLHDNKLYVLTDNGQLSCFNIVTGEPYYHQVRLPRTYNFKASPVAANGKLYLASEEGDVIVVKMGEKMEVITTNNFEDEVFIASPIIAEGDLFLRSQKYLYCISDNKAK